MCYWLLRWNVTWVNQFSSCGRPCCSLLISSDACCSDGSVVRLFFRIQHRISNWCQCHIRVHSTVKLYLHLCYCLSAYSAYRTKYKTKFLKIQDIYRTNYQQWISKCVDIKGATHQDGNTMLSEHQFIIVHCVTQRIRSRSHDGGACPGPPVRWLFGRPVWSYLARSSWITNVFKKCLFHGLGHKTVR